jgi:hypothetical protein
MKNPRFKEILPNYRKNALEVKIQEGRIVKNYVLPFAAFTGLKIGTRNRFTSITIDKELNSQGAFFTLTDGSEGSFPTDFVLYHCEPSYDWSPLNQLKRSLKGKLRGKLSVRVVADALRTSPSHVMRLLEENRGSKQILQLMQLAELAGYRIEFKLKKRSAA